MTWIIFVVLFSLFLAVGWIWSIWQTKKKRKSLPENKATMFDVRRLILKGEKDLAIRVYCSIFQTTYRKAKMAVDELEKSILEKNSDRG